MTSTDSGADDPVACGGPGTAVRTYFDSAFCNADCTRRDTRPSPVPTGTVGAFEGARYFHCDAYRPEFGCRMRDLGQPFCAVCQRRIRQVLPTRVPNVRELVSTVAIPRIAEAGLNPRTTGMSGPGAWVYQQSPRASTVVGSGSTVTLQLRTGPIP